MAETLEEAMENQAKEVQAVAQVQEEEQNKKQQEADLEAAAKKQEMIRKVKNLLLENKDLLILAGQLTLVTLVCVAGIKNDLTPDCCKKKKKRKKRK